MSGKGRFLVGFLAGLAMAVVIITASYTASIFIMRMGSNSVNAKEPSEGSHIDGDTLKKLSIIEDIIKENYALDMVSNEELEEGVYDGLVKALGDPYSDYFSEEEMKEQQQKLDGVYYGIGAYVSKDEETGFAKLGEIFDNSPAMKSGLREGDLILAVDDETTKDVELDVVVSRIKGDLDTIVRLYMYREEEGDFTVEVKRGSVPRVTVESDMFDGDIGYIYIKEFDLITVDQFADHLATLKGKGMKSLILDLRGNPGGNFAACIDIARMILPKGLVTYTLEKNGDRQDYFSDGKRELKMPLIVLVDGSSASASEILAGAIKDYGKGQLLGTTTYGKGIVQRYISLTDGSAVKLTTSKYYTPSGNNIHGIGIEPDIEVEFDGEKYMSEKTDNQLEKAKEILAVR